MCFFIIYYIVEALQIQPFNPLLRVVFMGNECPRDEFGTKRPKTTAEASKTYRNYSQSYRNIKAPGSKTNVYISYLMPIRNPVGDSIGVTVGSGLGEDAKRIATSNLETNLMSLIKSLEKTTFQLTRGCSDFQQQLLNGNIPSWNESFDIGISYTDRQKSERGTISLFKAVDIEHKNLFRDKTEEHKELLPESALK